MTSILPGKFDGSSDLAMWLREFDSCSLANDWKEEDKIKKLPAFLSGPAASHFYVIPADDRKTYKDAVKMLIGAMCPTAQRENFYAEFEARTLRREEDPAVYKWDLEQKLLKADPLIDGQAKEALLLRQFMRGLLRRWPDILPKDILLNGHFADVNFVEQTFCRTDSLTNRLFAKKTFCRNNNLPKIEKF